MSDVGQSGAATPVLRVLLAGSDAQAQPIASLLSAAANCAFQVVHAPSGWDAQRYSASGSYAALILDYSLGDTDAETLLGRLRATGVQAPALLLTPPGWVPTDAASASASGDDRMPRIEAFAGRALVRAVLAMVQRHDLASELGAARAEAAQSKAALAAFAHDMATPLGVAMGMTQVLLADDYGLNEDGRACLDDISLGVTRAVELLKRLDTAAPGLSPAARVDDVAHPAPSPRLESNGTVVLIADDDAATRRLVSVTLASDHYSVLQAADGKEAWRLIRQHHPAVAILDWQMPIYSGLELTDVIKSDPQVWGMTVIMLTGRTAPEDRAAGARARADLYLTKPFSTGELLSAVERALGIVH